MNLQVTSRPKHRCMGQGPCPQEACETLVVRFGSVCTFTDQQDWYNPKNQFIGFNTITKYKTKPRSNNANLSVLYVQEWCFGGFSSLVLAVRVEGLDVFTPSC